jgi:hypothetical protein
VLDAAVLVQQPSEDDADGLVVEARGQGGDTTRPMHEGVAVDEHVCLARQAARTLVVRGAEAAVLRQRQHGHAGKLRGEPLRAPVAGAVVDDDDPRLRHALLDERPHRPRRQVGGAPVDDDRGERA